MPISLVVIWAKLPELLIEYYQEDMLKDIVVAIGPVLRIDTHTASRSRGRYSRVCVQVDLCKPFIRSVQIGKLSQ